jgi:hypothetical protein
LFEDFLSTALFLDPKDLTKGEYEQLFAEFEKELFGAKAKKKPVKARDGGKREEAAGQDRIKEIYRMLVRRLHPDTRADGDATVSALWHQVQEAYEARDLDRMETLLALRGAGECVADAAGAGGTETGAGSDPAERCGGEAGCGVGFREEPVPWGDGEADSAGIGRECGGAATGDGGAEAGDRRLVWSIAGGGEKGRETIEEGWAGWWRWRGWVGGCAEGVV